MSNFRGSRPATLDAKGRLAIPALFKEALIAPAGGQLVVTADPVEKCLLLYTLPEWEKKQEELDAMPNTRQRIRWLQRWLTGNATDLEVDGSGRILLPSHLRDLCGFNKALVMIGQGKKVELWDQATWGERLEQKRVEASTLEYEEDEEIAGFSL